MQVHIEPAAVKGVLSAPPSKSLAHRALLCAALANGSSTVSRLEYSEDIEATLRAAQQMGARVLREGGTVTMADR